MKTLAITTDNRFASGLAKICSNVERLFSKENSIDIKKKVKDSRTSLEIKIGDSSLERRVYSVLVNQLARLLITDAKSLYIQNNMRLVIPDEVNRQAFVHALSSFDKETDLLIAKSLLVLTPHFALDSFYDFRVQPLKKRWQEVVHLANDNQAYLVCPRTFCELLRFLISNIDSQCDEVHIKEQICDVNGMSKIITRLIDLAPRKIVVHEGCNAQLATKIKTLFGKTVVSGG